jgi:hypothetical protein
LFALGGTVNVKVVVIPGSSACGLRSSGV